MTCSYCEHGDHPTAECHERLEDYHGTAAAHIDEDDEGGDGQ